MGYKKLEVNNILFIEGSVVFPITEKLKKIIDKLASNLHLKFYSVKEIDESLIKQIKKVRIGLYKPFTANMDEGWTRLLLENFEFEFKSLENNDFKQEKLKEKVDVIVIPGMSSELIKDGKPSR